MCLLPVEVRRGILPIPGKGVGVVVSHLIGAKTQTQVLCKVNKCSEPLSHLSSYYVLCFLVGSCYRDRMSHWDLRLTIWARLAGYQLFPVFWMISTSESFLSYKDHYLGWEGWQGLENTVALVGLSEYSQRETLQEWLQERLSYLPHKMSTGSFQGKSIADTAITRELSHTLHSSHSLFISVWHWGLLICHMLSYSWSCVSNIPGMLILRRAQNQDLTSNHSRYPSAKESWPGSLLNLSRLSSVPHPAFGKLFFICVLHAITLCADIIYIVLHKNNWLAMSDRVIGTTVVIQLFLCVIITGFSTPDRI